MCEITESHTESNTADGQVIVEQITGPIVKILIQAPHLARMFFGGYWSNLPDGPLENPRWRSCFQDGRHFHYSIKKNASVWCISVILMSLYTF